MTSISFKSERVPDGFAAGLFSFGVEGDDVGSAVGLGASWTGVDCTLGTGVGDGDVDGVAEAPEVPLI
ncbi:hypothetical protein D3C85_1389990 [compost metagenome]